MPDSTTPPVAPVLSRAKPGFIDQDLEDAQILAENCHREAAKPGVTPLLVEREWVAADQTALGDSLSRCGAFVQQLKEVRTGKKTRTKDEQKARALLLVALDPVIKGSRRKYADGSAERRAYGIGARLSSAGTPTLYDAAVYGFGQLQPGAGGTAAKDTLKGVLPSEIATLGTLATDYKNADWLQGDAQREAAKTLAKLRLEIESTLSPLRRDLQGAADQAYTHRNPVNAAQRKAFGLQPDRSLVD